MATLKYYTGTEWVEVGGGSGGTTNFNNLTNRPKYNGTTMTGSTNIPEVPTKTSDLTNDSGFLTAHQDISGKEDTSNKVTSVSSASTDTQYPTAKCLYDLCGDVETALDTINDMLEAMTE